MRPCVAPTWATDDAGFHPADCLGHRHRGHLCQPGARAGPDLPRDGRGQLRSGRDGNVLDLHQLLTDRIRALRLLERVRGHDPGFLRARRRDRTPSHPAVRGCTRVDAPDRHAWPLYHLQRGHRTDLGLRIQGLPWRVPQHAGAVRRPLPQHPGPGRVRRGTRDAAASLPVLLAHQGRPRDAGCLPISGQLSPPGRSRGLDVGARLGLGVHGGRRIGAAGGADHLPRPQHDAGDPPLRLRSCRPGWDREPIGSRHRRCRSRHGDGAGGDLYPGRPGPPFGVWTRRHRRGSTGAPRRFVRTGGGEAGVRRLPRVRPELLGLAVIGGIVVLGVPTVTNQFVTFEFAKVAIFAIALMGLNLLTGYSGQISLGNGAFMAVGGYTTAILVQRTGIPYWTTIPVAALVAGGFGFVIGIPALRLTGVYLALATFALALSVPPVLNHYDTFTGGHGGIVMPAVLPPFSLDLSQEGFRPAHRRLVLRRQAGHLLRGAADRDPVLRAQRRRRPPPARVAMVPTPADCGQIAATRAGGRALGEATPGSRTPCLPPH